MWGTILPVHRGTLTRLLGPSGSMDSPGLMMEGECQCQFGYQSLVKLDFFLFR